MVSDFIEPVDVVVVVEDRCCIKSLSHTHTTVNLTTLTFNSITDPKNRRDVAGTVTNTRPRPRVSGARPTKAQKQNQTAQEKGAMDPSTTDALKFSWQQVLQRL